MKEKHCCFNTEQNFICSAKIHVPLAEKCSMGCIYCNYINDRNITNCKGRPGTASMLVTGCEGIKAYLEKAFELIPECNIVSISGPGEPLENYEQIEILQEIMKNQYPEKLLCVCSNGRYYEQFFQLVDNFKNIKYFTVTINSLNPNTVQHIYKSINSNREALDFIDGQISIIKCAKQHRIKVKVNTVYLSGINDKEIVSMFGKLQEYGVDCFNFLNQIQSGNAWQQMKNVSYDDYRIMRNHLAEQDFPLTSQCRQCTSDFCGY